MWRGFTGALMLYMNAAVAEWVKRGFNNSYKLWSDEDIARLTGTSEIVMPPWLGDERVHSSHRAALLFKDQTWYSQFNWPEKPIKDYFWPA
jgi:hypothetical protein